MTRIVYLHGFASSPQSTKAQYFLRRFAEAGTPVEIPQLDEGNFEGLTISGQLRVIDRAVKGDPVVLMGSSLGGYLAALYAARHGNVERVVLLAPAFQLPTRWRARFTPQELDEWKRHGTKPFFHYGFKCDMPLGYQFVEDTAQYEDDPDFRQPGLIFHGRNDPVVPAEASETFAQRHPNVALHVLDSGHELTDVLDQVWSEAVKFLIF